MLLVFAAFMAVQQAPYAGELRERLNSPIKATVESKKMPYDLELCVADVLTITGTPSVFRDGPENVVIVSSLPASNTYMAAVSIERIASGSRLNLRLRGKGWDDRVTDRIKACA